VVSNDLNSVVPVGADPNQVGSQVIVWDVVAQDFGSSGSSLNSKGKWNPDLTFAPGVGFFILMNVNYTNTWVGDVAQGAVSTTIHGNSALDLIGSRIPMGGSLNTNVMPGWSSIGTVGDQIITFNVSTGDFDTAGSSFNSKGRWNPDAGTGLPGSFSPINVGDSFLILAQTAGPTAYVRNFTVQ